MNLRLLPYTPERDVYQLLGVAPTASHEEVNAACRRLARTFHPDRNGSARANQEMQVVNAVRSVLTDPASRAVYDRERYRFLALRERRVAVVVSTPAQPATRMEVPRAASMPSPRARYTRYARAALLGLRALASGLAPARCRTCRIVIERDDAYCAACGTPLLTGG